MTDECGLLVIAGEINSVLRISLYYEIEIIKKRSIRRSANPLMDQLNWWRIFFHKKKKTRIVELPVRIELGIAFEITLRTYLA